MEKDFTQVSNIKAWKKEKENLDETQRNLHAKTIHYHHEDF